MALPQAIQSQVDQADALYQQIYGEGQATDPPVDQPASEDSGVVEPAGNVVELPRQAVQATEAPPPAPAKEETAEYWRDRFRTVQGKLDNEMPQMYQQIRDQGQQIKQLLEKLEQAQKPPEPERAEDSLVSQKDVDDFGADLVDMTRRAARDVFRELSDKLVAELRTEFGAVKEQVGHVAQRVEKTETDTFWGEVNRLVPDWASVNEDPRWIEMLNSRVPGTRNTYRDEAMMAIRDGDYRYIAEVVGLWRKALPQDTQQPPAGQQELSRQVAPNTAKSSQSTPPGEKIWSHEEYAAAMDVRNERRFGKKKAEELESEATRAVAEGRVRW